ncbi:5-azacytidine resistance protein azr1 [Venturia nashicola]|uniref:Protein phosphatase n=1 Tax=Venturia nashicola TaxID=86259 RepID=A0A4Z1NLB6_9PEZI|nr:5-azacytidine resistance protein azr1 [Venturia nashicola]
MSAARTLRPLQTRHYRSFLRPPNLQTFRHSLGLAKSQEHGSINRSLTSVRTFTSSSTTFSSNPKFSYSISASYSDKKKHLDPLRNIHTHDQTAQSGKDAYLPLNKEQKLARPKSGQDSFFVARVNKSEHTALAVVDGVGGWASSGIDSADFAHSLCEYMSSAASTFPLQFETKSSQTPTPQELLKVGTDKVMADKTVHAGGSTACVATISSSGVLEVANLGDSGYAHLTPFRLSSISPPQTHDFNSPFQLSKLPPKLLKQVTLFGNGHHGESASDAALTTHRLSHGDVLVFATDGVWDNLSPQDTLQIVSKIMLNTGAWKDPDMGSTSAGKDLAEIVQGASQKFASWPYRSLAAKTGALNARGGEMNEVRNLSAILATAITHEAKAASLDWKRDGPFAREVQKYYPWENWTGGKVDDICTIVVVVIEN